MALASLSFECKQLLNYNLLPVSYNIWNRQKIVTKLLKKGFRLVNTWNTWSFIMESELERYVYVWVLSIGLRFWLGPAGWLENTNTNYNNTNLFTKKVYKNLTRKISQSMTENAIFKMGILTRNYHYKTYIFKAPKYFIFYIRRKYYFLGFVALGWFVGLVFSFKFNHQSMVNVVNDSPETVSQIEWNLVNFGKTSVKNELKIVHIFRFPWKSTGFSVCPFYLEQL